VLIFIAKSKKVKSGVSIHFILAIYIPVTIIMVSCGDDFGSSGSEEFDREALLENLGANVIIPSYESYREGVIALKQRSIEFTQVPNAQTLQTLREQFKSSYLLWQKCSFYEFGPAAEISLKSSTNSFPADVQKINTNISSGIYDLNMPINRTAIGFPAIDYLIYGNDKTDNQLIIDFVDEPFRRAYLNDLVLQMEDNIEFVVDEWNPNGNNYLEGFIVKSGTDANSSPSLLYNAFSSHLETNTKDGKIGIPMGILPGGLQAPDDTEAFYSQISVPYMSENTEAMKQFFLGDYNGNSGLGFDDWLDARSARYEDRLLSNVIGDQFDLSISSISEINDPFSITLIENPLKANEAFNNLQLLSDLIQTNVSTAFEIALVD